MKVRTKAPVKHWNTLTEWSPWVEAKVCPSGETAMEMVDVTVCGRSKSTNSWIDPRPSALHRWVSSMKCSTVLLISPEMSCCPYSSVDMLQQSIVSLGDKYEVPLYSNLLYNVLKMIVIRSRIDDDTI